ncbi:aminotransferase class I/II-fold pyridoxal phosphate-dependent enzyme [soil metagenome]
MNFNTLLAERTTKIEVSGIRKVFDLARSLKDPVNLSIGQPHFPVPDAIKQAACDAINTDKNGYTPTQGVMELRSRILANVNSEYPGQERDVIITSGTSGGLLLALLAVVNPGDEVIVPDPYFVAYPHLVTLAAGKAVYVDTYPDFRIDPAKIEAAITPKTKAILLCGPANPTGAIIEPAVQKAVVEIARKHGVLVISDEIYKAFHYDTPPRSPAEYDPNVLVIEGFGKTYGITGWRLGFAHGPKRLIDEMMKLQQFTFVCAPSMVQFAGLAALDFDVSGIVSDYKRKRDLLVAGLKDTYQFNIPGGAFYLFAQVPGGKTGSEFVAEAIQRNMLIIPGGSFSHRDDHFRISYAANDETLHRGIAILRSMV